MWWSEVEEAPEPPMRMMRDCEPWPPDRLSEGFSSAEGAPQEHGEGGQREVAEG